MNSLKINSKIIEILLIFHQEQEEVLDKYEEKNHIICE